MQSTGFPDLDELLQDFTVCARETLGADLVGLYLQGSFALGDADEHSDVDWIAVIEDEIETGEVRSKREAGEWALETLPSEWSGLIHEALDDRPDPWTKVGQPATPEAVQRTLAFADYALSRPRPSRP